MASRRCMSVLTASMLLASCGSLCACDDPAPTQPTKSESVQVGDKPVKLNVLTEEKDRREAALTGAHPGPGEGTLLVYPAPEVVRIDTSAWTTPLDIVFLDRDGKVVGKKEEPAPVAPKATPKPDAKVFSNTTPAFFTLMLPAGGGAALKDGESLKLDAPKLIKQAQGPLVDVTISGQTFHLEEALTFEKRLKGLSDRKEIAPDGGMLFAFPYPQTLNFVMRDCPTDIDILFLDGTGRVVATHHMPSEAARNPDEQLLDANGVNNQYEDRLKKYPSGFAAQFAIELKGGSLAELKPPVKRNDKIPLDLEGLKKKAK